MRKLFKFILALAVVFCMVAPVQAAYHDYWANVYSWDGKMTTDGKPVLTRLTSGVTFKVLAVGTDTSETLTYYNVEAMTSLTNPVTTTNFASNSVCNDRVAFRCDPTDATNDRDVDLIVVNTAGGYTAFVEDFSYYNHSIIIDQRPNIQHHGCIWFAASTAETDTGINFVYDTFIHDVWVEIVTVDATETLDVGLLSSETAGDANGLRALVSVATAGYPTDTAVITGGTNIDYIPVTTYGALLVTAITGSDAVATCGGKSYIGHIVTGANAVSLTHTGSAGSDTAAGYIHYFFTRLR